MKRRTQERVPAERDVLRDLVLRAIARQGGEFTTGRVKQLAAAHNLTHVYRSKIRSLLRQLHAEGLLLRHSTPGRLYYTPAKGGAQ